MKQYSYKVYDCREYKEVILKTDTPITQCEGDGITRCKGKCNWTYWDYAMNIYKDKAYCDECLIDLLKESK